MNDSDAAHWIVEQSAAADALAERVNMGMWYFGAQISRSDYRMRRALDDLDVTRELEEQHRASLGNARSGCR